MSLALRKRFLGRVPETTPNTQPRSSLIPVPNACNPPLDAFAGEQASSSRAVGGCVRRVSARPFPFLACSLIVTGVGGSSYALFFCRAVCGSMDVGDAGAVSSHSGGAPDTVPNQARALAHLTAGLVMAIADRTTWRSGAVLVASRLPQH